MTATRQRWDTSAYGEITSARHDRGVLVVAFGNGDRVRIPVDHLQAPHLQDPDWSAVRFTPDEVVVPTPTSEVEISWFSLRAISDDEFAAYLDDFAAEETHRSGAVSTGRTPSDSR